MSAQMPSVQRMDDASQQARDLAEKIAPFLRDLKRDLARNHVSPKQRTASYVLALAAAGFLTEELSDRKSAATDLRDIAEAIADDLVQGQRF